MRTEEKWEGKQAALILTFQLLQYPTQGVELEKEKEGSMYDTHIWDIVLVNTILRNTWYFITCTVKAPSFYPLLETRIANSKLSNALIILS